MFHDDVFVDRPYKSHVRDPHDSDGLMRRTISPLSYHMHQHQISAQSNQSTVCSNPPIRRSSLRNLREGNHGDVTYAENRMSNSQLVDPRYIYGHPSERNALTTSKSSIEQSKPVNEYQKAYIDLAAHPYDSESAVDERSSYDFAHLHDRDEDIACHPSYEGNGYTSPYLPTLKEAEFYETMDQDPTVEDYPSDLFLGLDPDSREYYLEYALRTLKNREADPEQPQLQIAKSFEKSRAATQIPSPIIVPSIEKERKYYLVAEQATEAASTSPEPLTGTNAPAIPPKNPLRNSGSKKNVNQSQAHTSAAIKPTDIRARRLAVEIAQTTRNLRGRIISKENIRAALDFPEEEVAGANGLIPTSPTLPSSPNSPVSVNFGHGFAGIGGRGLNTGESPKLQTFSSHMFSRSSSSLRRPAGKAAGVSETPAKVNKGSKEAYKLED